MTAVLPATHLVQWWSAEPERMSAAANQAALEADELAVSAIAWFELARLAQRDRILVTVPIRTWREDLARQVGTIGGTPVIAAAALPPSFPSDPGDRLIYATAIDSGCRSITKDDRIRGHRYPQPLAWW